MSNVDDMDSQAAHMSYLSIIYISSIT